MADLHPLSLLANPEHSPINTMSTFSLNLHTQASVRKAVCPSSPLTYPVLPYATPWEGGYHLPRVKRHGAVMPQDLTALRIPSYTSALSTKHDRHHHQRPSPVPRTSRTAFSLYLSICLGPSSSVLWTPLSSGSTGTREGWQRRRRLVATSFPPDHSLEVPGSPCRLSPLSLSFWHPSNRPSFLPFDTGFLVDSIF